MLKSISLYVSISASVTGSTCKNLNKKVKKIRSCGQFSATSTKKQVQIQVFGSKSKQGREGF